MMKHLPEFLLIAFLLLLSTGCNSDPTRSAPVAAFEGETMLLLPPLTKDSRAGGIIGRSLHEQMLQHYSSDIKYADDIPELQSVLTRSNLVVDGRLNYNEAAHLASTLNASSVAACRLISLNSYPPQRATMEISLILMEGKKFTNRNTLMSINLDNAADRQAFLKFYGTKEKGSFEKKFTERDVKGTAHLLSNEKFYRFLGFEAAKKAVYMKKYLR